MTKLQRLLALEAAFIACEGITGAKDQASVAKLIDKLNAPEEFGAYCKAQQEACLELAANPPVFGGEPISDEVVTT